MSLVGDVEPSERLVILAPHGAPHDALGLSPEELVDVSKLCDQLAGSVHPQFRGDEEMLAHGLLRTSNGNRFAIGRDGSIAIRRRLSHDRAGYGRVVTRGDVGLYTSLEQILASVLLARTLVTRSRRQIFRWSFRHELHGVKGRHLMDDVVGEGRTEGLWEKSKSCPADLLEFAGELNLADPPEQFAELLDRAAQRIAVPFGLLNSVRLMGIGVGVIATSAHWPSGDGT